MSETEKNLQIRQAFDKARAARTAGKRQEAIAGWAEVLAMTEAPTTPEQRQARMAAASESALVYQETGDMRRAHDLLREAVAQAEASVSANPDPEAWLALAGVRVNLASLLVANRIAAEGADVANAALEAVERAGEREGRVLLTFAAKMQLGSSKLLQGDAVGGAEVLAEAAEQGCRLVESGQQGGLPQLVECIARMAAGARLSNALEKYLPLVERTARLAEAAFAAAGAPFLNIFVAAQMHLATWLTETGRFAQAEDVLWKTIDGSGQGALLVSAPNFYASVWRRDDAALVAGDLPRDEVRDAWLEAIDKAESRGADALAVQGMRVRYGMHVEAKLDEARTFLEDHRANKNDVSALSREVLVVLEQELNALQAS